MTEASEDFGGVTWNGQKQWGHRSHPWCSMVRGAGWKICPEEKDVNWNFELPCYWQRHRWTPFCCHRYRASWWNQNHRTPKKGGTTKITKEKYFGPKKRVWMCENCAPGSRISKKIISILTGLREGGGAWAWCGLCEVGGALGKELGSLGRQWFGLLPCFLSWNQTFWPSKNQIMRNHKAFHWFVFMNKLLQWMRWW